MKTTRCITFILLVIATQVCLSQSIIKSVVGSCGSTQATELNSISWTVGETVVGTMTGGHYQLSNGFLPSLNLEALFIPEKPNSGVFVYPNPAKEFVSFKKENLSNLEVKITDLNGKVLSRLIVFPGDEINISNLKQGVYLMQTLDIITKQLDTFKIIVNRN